MATATIPVNVKPDAAARIAELGLQREFERMLDHARQTIPDLRAIHVTLVPDPCPDIEPGIVLWAQREALLPGDDPTNRNFGAWQVETFPPQVCIHFSLICVDEDANDW